MADASVPSAARAGQEADTLLLAFVRDRDVQCPICAYNLRDLLQPRCPECGERLTLGLCGEDRRNAWAIAGLIPLSGGACFNVGVALFFLYAVFIENDPMGGRDWEIFSLGFVLPAAVFIGMMTAWLKSWQRLRRTVSGRTRVLVLLAWALPFVDVGFLRLLTY